MPATDYASNLWLGSFGLVRPTIPANFYLELFKVAPTATAGTGGSPITGTGYARQIISGGTPAARQVANTGLISFTASAPADWGGQSVVAFGVYDALTSGNIWWYDPATPNLLIGTGSPVQVPIGQFLLIFS